MASNKSTNSKSIVLSSEYEISSPESNDSGIHSEDRLNRLSNGATAQNSVKTSAESSLYSSVISSKKSSDRLSREASAYSRLDEFGELLQMQQQKQQKQLQQEEIQVYRNQIDVKQLEEDQNVVEYEEINSGDNFLHLEQHELPLGWVRCCDEEGIYYWHKPSGTVTRHPPAIPVKPTTTTTSTTRTTNSSSNSNISSSTSSSKGTTPSPSPLSSSECSSSSAPTTTVLNAVQHPAPTSKSPPAKNFNVNNEYESILETTTLAMATSTDDDDNDEAKTFTFSEYVRPKSKTTTATSAAAATNQTATSASEDRSMIGGGGPDSTSLSTFSNLSSSALSNSFDQPAKAQPALLPLPLSHFSRPSNPSTDTDLDQDNFQDNEDKKPSMFGNRKDRPTKHINIQTRYGSDFTSVSPLSTSSSNSTSSSSSNCLSALDNTKSSRHNNRSQIKQDDKSHHQVESVVLTRRDGEASVANSSKPSLPIRFYVRSLGWVTISEADLTPERSSRAVNKCINDLSRGTKDLNDVVARWGDGKDLYMDLDDSNLVLIDPIDDNVLNTQPITSIRVWGVGRDNARDFAYVARDKQTKIHMCHVFRCDSAPAKEIANTLKETCRRVIAAEKSRSSFGGVATTVVDSAAPTTTTTTATNSQTSLNNRLANMMLKRPSYLPDIAVNTSKVDINLKLRSVSFNSREEVEERLSAMAMATSTTASIIEENNVGGSMLTPMDEPCKRHPCKYLGSLPVNKPYGMDVLNDAVDKIYNRALDEYRKMRREKRMKSRRGRRKKAGLYRHDSGKNDKQGYDDDDMDDDMDDYDYDEDDDDDEDDECDEMNTVSFDSMFELNSERKLGCDVDVCVSPSTITVRRRASNSHDIVDDDEVLFETRIRFLSFMGISNDVRLCGFIVHCVDNSFRCYAFMCENSCGPLCKTIEAACKLRYQKCIDAHPEAAGVVSSRNGAQNDSRLNSRFGNFGIQISKTVFDSITKTRSIFSNLNLANISNNNNNNSSNGKSTKM